MRLARTWVRLLPELLLVLVAAISIGRVIVIDATSWSGGAGFTMFARTDYAATRYVKLFEFSTIGEPVPITVPTELTAHVDRVRALPTERNLTMLADAYLSSADANQVRVEVWWLDFDGATVTPTFKGGIQRDTG